MLRSSEREHHIGIPYFRTLMLPYGVGCRVEETLYVKKIDKQFFED